MGDPHAGRVERDPQAGEQHHGAHLHRLGVQQALVAFDRDARRDGEEQRAVDERCEDLEAVVPVSALRIGRPRADAQGEEREPDGASVGQHVAGVGEQREAVGEPAAERLGHHGDERHAEGQQKPALLSSARRARKVVGVLAFQIVHEVDISALQPRPPLVELPAGTCASIRA